MNDSEKSLNSVSKIDKISRIVFPSTYLGNENIAKGMTTNKAKLFIKYSKLAK